jgi:hypothetical protein
MKFEHLSEAFLKDANPSKLKKLATITDKELLDNKEHLLNIIGSGLTNSEIDALLVQIKNIEVNVDDVQVDLDLFQKAIEQEDLEVTRNKIVLDRYKNPMGVLVAEFPQRPTGANYPNMHTIQGILRVEYSNAQWEVAAYPTAASDTRSHNDIDKPITTPKVEDASAALVGIRSIIAKFNKKYPK